MGDIREIDFRRETVPDGSGGEVDGYAIRIWVDGPEDGDETLALTVQGPRDLDDGDLGRLLKERPIDDWVEIVLGLV